MTDTVAELCWKLELSPHPEGGYYKEIYRSSQSVLPADGREKRSSLTLIYYLLPEGEQSRWHSVRSDELWHFLAGSPLELLTLSAELADVRSTRLGAFSECATATYVVPAGGWQAARPTGEYSLVSCAVAPGFDFADFELLAQDEVKARLLRARHPALGSLV